MNLASPAAALAFLALPAIAALYFLKSRGPQTGVGSLLCWPRHVTDRQANAPWKRLRGSWLLLVQLLLAAALAFALLRPELVGAAGVGGTTVVMIDGSPSMRATDVAPSRFDAAVSRARRMAGQIGSDGQMAVILLGDHAQLLAGPTNDVRQLRAALDRARPSGQAADLEEGFSVANAVLSGRPAASVILLSDGHAERPVSPLRVAAPFTYESIGTTAENVAIQSMSRTPGGEIGIRLVNAGRSARALTVEMLADGRLVDVLPVRVGEGSSAEATWSQLPPGTRLLEARLKPGDAFGLDDAAWLVTEAPAPRRALLVTGGNGFLARALGLRENLEVTVVDPARYAPAPYDLYVFDGFVPPGALPLPALVIAPPSGAGPAPTGQMIDPGELLPANPREPLLDDVSLRDVHVLEAAAVKVPPDWRVVVAATNGPLLMVQQGQARVAQINFDLHRSDLPLRAAFPILVDNLVSHLLPGGSASQVFPLGEPVGLAGDPDVRSVAVTTPGGRSLTFLSPLPVTLDDTSEPGVYTVKEQRPEGATITRFVVQLQDPSQSLIAPGNQPSVRRISRPAGEEPRGTRELWPWMAALGLAALLAETVVFLRS